MVGGVQSVWSSSSDEVELCVKPVSVSQTSGLSVVWFEFWTSFGCEASQASQNCASVCGVAMIGTRTVGLGSP